MTGIKGARLANIKLKLRYKNHRPNKTNHLYFTAPLGTEEEEEGEGAGEEDNSILSLRRAFIHCALI